MNGCAQEMCPNWDGFSCPCEVFDIAKPGACPDCGNREGMSHDPWDGRACSICDWQENPL